MDANPDILVSPGALRATRIAAVFSSLAIFAFLAFALWSFARSLFRLQDLLPVLPLLFLIAPYVLLQFRLRPGFQDWPQRAKSALAWAVPWSLFVVLAAALILRFLTHAETTPEILLPITLALVGIIALAGTALAVSGLLVSRSLAGVDVARPLWLLGFAKAAAWAALTFLVGTMTIPAGEPNRVAANEALAVGSLRTICTSQVEYSLRHPDKGFARSLGDPGPPPGIGLIDSQLATGIRLGYHFEMVPGPLDGQGRTASFAATARPLEFGVTGYRNFFTDQTDVIRWTSRNRRASLEDLPLE